MDTDYVLVIHGTWDTPREGKDSWFQLHEEPGNFSYRLNELLKTAGDRGPVWRAFAEKRIAFFWSGANEHMARIEGGEKLFNVIVQIIQKDPTARIHLIAHSHGGNVVLNALERYLTHLGPEAKFKLFRDWRPQSPVATDANRIGRLVFIGTPFFKKLWPQPFRTLPAVIRFIVDTIGMSVLMYVMLFIFVGWWAIPGAVGLLQPNLWPHPQFIGLLLLSIVLGVWISFLARQREPVHVYFNDRLALGETLFPGLPYECLVVSAGPLDEVLLAMATEPIVYGMLRPQTRKLLFEPPRRYEPISATYETPTDWVLNPLRYVVFIVRRVVGFCLYPVIWPFKKLLEQYLISTFLAVLSGAGFGLNPREFKGTTIVASSRPDLKNVLRDHYWDIALLLTSQPPRPAANQLGSTPRTPAVEQFAFLWDALRLSAMARSSWLWPQLDSLSDELWRRAKTYQDPKETSFRSDLQRVSLTVEQRIKEMIGRIEFAHSQFDSNDEVVMAIAAFIRSGELPPGVA